MKNKKALVTILLVVLLLGGSAAFLLTRSLVVFVKPNVPKEVAEKFTYPGLFQKGYLAIPLSEKNLSLLASVKTPDLVVYTPLSSVPEDTYHTLQWGTAGSKADITVHLDETTMWADALEHLQDKPVAMFFERYDSMTRTIYNTLSEKYPNLAVVQFEGRVSGVNIEALVSELDAFYAVLAPSVLETEDALRKTKSKVVMDEREAVSIMTMDRIISITLDWTELLPEALRMETGTLEAHYTTAVVH